MDQRVFSPTYTNSEKRVLSIDLGGVPLPEGITKDNFAVVHFEPGGWGGNHRHPRREAFVAFGEDIFITWVDENGKRHEASMLRIDGQLTLFTVSSNTPHMIENRSKSVPATILEFGDSPASLPDTTPLTGKDSLR